MYLSAQIRLGVGQFLTKHVALTGENLSQTFHSLNSIEPHASAPVRKWKWKRDSQVRLSTSLSRRYTAIVCQSVNMLVLRLIYRLPVASYVGPHNQIFSDR